MQEKSSRIEDILSRLRIFFKVKTNRAVAERLGVSEQAVSNWKKRQTIDWDLLHNKAAGVDWDWLMTGHESKSSAWKGLDMEVVGTKDPPKGTTADVMLSPAHCGDAAEIFEGVAAQIDIGIEEGDMLLIDVEREPKNGNIVLVRIADKVSVKRLKKNGEEVLLTPENPEYEPIPLSKDVRVLAVVLRAEKWFV